MNKFKVYNGPMPLPKCKVFWSKSADLQSRDITCGTDICPDLSTEFCKAHSLQSVREWDSRNAQVEK